MDTLIKRILGFMMKQDRTLIKLFGLIIMIFFDGYTD